MLLKHSSIYSASVLLNGLVGFAAVAINTRLLGAEEYGHYALALGSAMCASTLVFEWLRISNMRFSETKDGPELLSSSLSLYIVGGIIAMSLTALCFAINFNTYFPATGWIAVGLFAVCLGVVDLFLALARSSLRPTLFSSMQIIRGVLALAFGGLAAWMKFGFVGVIIGMAIANILTLLFGFIKQPAWQLLRPKLPDKQSIMTLVGFGFPLVMTIIALQVLLLVDRFMISYFHGASEVGAYAAASDITQKLILMIATGVNLASYNLVLKTYDEEGLAQAEHKLGTTLSVLLAITLPVAVGIILIANPMGHLLLGASVAEGAISLMPMLSLIAILQMLRTCYFDQPYHILKITNKIFWPYLGASVVAVIAWLFLIPSLGAMGAAYGLILAHLAGAGFSYFGIRDKFKLHIVWKDVVIVLVALVAMAVVVAIMPWQDNVVWLLVRIGLGGACYAMIMILGNFMDVRHVILSKVFK
ncbi:MAG: lipopolysaccharide biosynthesis protein [Alphaproteobacteria bacterium]|nr:lipopolysaccharide biosynthesis protein [Alphaproteobacteria bacterium]